MNKYLHIVRRYTYCVTRVSFRRIYKLQCICLIQRIAIARLLISILIFFYDVIEQCVTSPREMRNFGQNHAKTQVAFLSTPLRVRAKFCRSALPEPLIPLEHLKKNWLRKKKSLEKLKSSQNSFSRV